LLIKKGEPAKREDPMSMKKKKKEESLNGRMRKEYHTTT